MHDRYGCYENVKWEVANRWIFPDAHIRTI